MKMLFSTTAVIAAVCVAAPTFAGTGFVFGPNWGAPVGNAQTMWSLGSNYLNCPAGNIQFTINGNGKANFSRLGVGPRCTATVSGLPATMKATSANTFVINSPVIVVIGGMTCTFAKLKGELYNTSITFSGTDSSNGCQVSANGSMNEQFYITTRDANGHK